MTLLFWHQPKVKNWLNRIAYVLKRLKYLLEKLLKLVSFQVFFENLLDLAAMHV